jgi:hypothetical protein
MSADAAKIFHREGPSAAEPQPNLIFSLLGRDLRQSARMHPFAPIGVIRGQLKNLCAKEFERLQSQRPPR